jgi:hypothetical protein
MVDDRHAYLPGRPKVGRHVIHKHAGFRGHAELRLPLLGEAVRAADQ